MAWRREEVCAPSYTCRQQLGQGECPSFFGIVDHPAGSEFRGVALVLESNAAWRGGLRSPKGAAYSSRSLARKSLVKCILVWAGDLGPTRKVYWIPLPGHTDQNQYSRPREDLQHREEEGLAARVSAIGWGRTLATGPRLGVVESVFFRVVQVQVEEELLQLVQATRDR